ncbi:flagellar motor protein MotB [Luteimonas terrae]|uniref:Flagellar motor protein MotD n=1 Tax=Luteimonas terrae TaxID=1530191 RepID=A0A4R5U7X8_9GAMM|nr:flagellar motor protein MotB [Luteimonas terrae]TDK30579.1 flagellar motor protein MotD [Luteimonas terrae]
MAKKHAHEEHANHEAWAIPYGDLVTLLLAFFVVMYAISSVNEGKYRAVSDSLNAAFGGPPRSIEPVQLGRTQRLGSSYDRPSMMTAAAKNGPAPASMMIQQRLQQTMDIPRYATGPDIHAHGGALDGGVSGDGAGSGRSGEGDLVSLGRNIQEALSELVQKNLVTLRRGQNYLEVEIQSDILFSSGVAVPSSAASETIRKVAGVLREVPNAMRVEGYTDNQPIRSALFPSNWELSTARAASVVHILAAEGIAQSRLGIVGYGEFQPIADNATVEGRNANRRVMLVILAAPQGPDAVPTQAAIAAAPAPVPLDESADPAAGAH